MVQTGKSGVLAPGDQLDSYQILELIGVGGVGEVYRAINVTSQRMVAIKILLAEHAKDEDHLERMRRELHDIVHPAIVRYFDMHHSESFGGLHYLAMEFIPGPSLAEKMKQAPVDPAILEQIARSVLGGLEACHRGQIYHRDISPDNIILRNDDPGSATLIDFGIAKDVRPDAKTVVGTGFEGKYAYAAPEQLDDQFDERSDLYSLGATLIAAARGKVPSLGGSLVDVLRIKSTPIDTSGLPQPLQSLLSALTAVSQDDRPASAGAALAILNGHKTPGTSNQGSSANVTSLSVDEMLSGLSNKDKPKEAPKPTPSSEKHQQKKRGGTIVKLASGIALLAAIVFFVAPIRDAVFGPPLPTKSPYTMTMEKSVENVVRIEGHAPSEEAAQTLTEALERHLDADNAQITPALGAPGKEGEWGNVTEILAQALARLQQGRVVIENQKGTLKGTAINPEEKEDIGHTLQEAGARYRFELESELDVLPQPVERQKLVTASKTIADCGPLKIEDAPNGKFPPRAEINVSGTVGSEDTLQILRTLLEGLLDEQKLVLNGIKIINPSVCRVRSMLPPNDNNDNVVINYSSGNTDVVLTDNYFDPDDTPIADITIPSDHRGYLHAFVVDNEFNTIHLRPGPKREKHKLSEIGEVENGIRTIRLLFPKIEGWDWSTPYFAFTEPYGEMRIYAIVTNEPLFPILRGNQEDTRDFVPDLAESLAERNDFKHAERPMRVNIP